MSPTRRLTFLSILAVAILLACQTITPTPLEPTARPAGLPTATPVPPPTQAPTATLAPTATAVEEASATRAATAAGPLPQPSADEPVFISGDIPYTSPFFVNMISEPFVLLEDEAGFIRRNLDFAFPLKGQTIGAVEIHNDQSLTYSLTLPAQPRGTQVDVDHDGIQEPGVQVFVVAFWSNTWGGPFLEKRDGTGWSSAYASSITDPERDNEISGGILIAWSPDAAQDFPTGFGVDGLLFSDDDPTAPIPAGYNLVDLNQQPFRIYKEAQPEITLLEGDIAVNDFSALSYEEAFKALYEKASVEYPFTAEKGIDWQALYTEFAPRIAAARDSTAFYRALRDFTFAIPDAHIGGLFDPQVFYEEQGGSFGLVLAELSDSRVIVTQVLPGYPGEAAGIKVGAEITSWSGQPVSEAIGQVVSYFGPYSTEHHKRLGQILFLTRVPSGTEVEVAFKNSGQARLQTVKMTAVDDYDSLFAALPSADSDPLAAPVEARQLPGSGLGYIRISTFSDDYNLLARLWERAIQALKDQDLPGLIIDLRQNGGGSGGLALDFAGYFFSEGFPLYQTAYYNSRTGQFEYTDYQAEIRSAPFYYEGPVALLVSPDCVSACEGFAYAMTQQDRAIVVGHYPTAGAYGEVGRGQYALPDDQSLQFPTGRPETLDGQVLIEGQGIPLDITVPVTVESALGQVDAVLQAAVEALANAAP